MTTENDRSAAVHQAIGMIITTSRLHHRGIENQLSETGLHRGQRMMLLHLSDHDSVPSQRELADRFNISPACVARTLKALANEGYINRISDADDQRRNHVSITEKGLKLIRETRTAFDQFDQTACDGITDEELTQLTSLLKRMQENLQRSEERCSE